MTFLAVEGARKLLRGFLSRRPIAQPTVRTDEIDGRLGAVGHAYNMTPRTGRFLGVKNRIAFQRGCSAGRRPFLSAVRT
jgi:hypothetical protein